MATMRMYDSLGYAKTLVKRGVEPKVAEAFAETNQEYYETVIDDLATKEFVRHEITSLEKRMTMTIGKMLAFAVGVILAGIPIILAIMQRLSVTTP